MVALASAFIRVAPDPDTAAFKKQGAQAGKDAADAYAASFKRDAAGRLRQANGQFATDAQKAALGYGSASGKQYSSGFAKTSGGFLAGLKNQFKGAVALAAPASLAAAAVYIGKIGIQYEDNLNIFQAVTKATGAQMDQVAAKARALGADVKLPGVSAAGAAAAMTELGKAGFTVQQSMDAARATLQLARIANISEADAATIAANAVNAFGIKAKDTGFVVDELAAAANSSSVEISDVSLAFKQASAVFSGFQGPAVGSKEAVTELNTAIAILGNNGIKGSDAGTSLKQALLQLTGPTQGAKDQMKELALVAQGANVTLDQQNRVLHGSKSVREAALAEILKANPAMKAQGDIAYDASGKMRSLRDILALTAAGTKNMSQEQRNYAITQIFGADASRSIIALLKGGLPVYDAQRKAVLQTGAAADVAAAKNKGLGGAIDNVKSQFENAAISIYNLVKGPLTNALNGLANALPGIFATIGKVFGFLADHKGTVLGVAYAVGVLTLAVKANAVATAIASAGGIIKYLLTFGKVARVAAAGQSVLNIALSANPIGLVVVALGALVAAFVVAYKNSARFREIVQGALNGVKTAAVAVADFFTTTFWPGVVRVFNAVKNAVVSFYQNGVKPAFTAVVGFLRSYVFPVFTFLYVNVVRPVFSAVGKIISIWWLGVKVIFAALRLYLTNVLFPVLRFLYNNVVRPVFAAVGKAIQIWWFGVRIIFAALKLYFTNVLFPVIRFLYNNVIKPVFAVISKVIQVWWFGVRIIFAALKLYLTTVVFPVIRFLYNNVIRPIFTLAGQKIAATYNNIIKPTFNFIRTLFQATGKGLAVVYNTIIKPMLERFGGFIKNNVAPAFSRGVEAIKAAWNKVKDAARTPIKFVVDHVINPFIGGLNSAAKTVGLKDRIDPIHFAKGGQTPVGHAQGGKISGAGGMTDNRQAMIPGLGPVQLMGGEFIVNRQDTAKALPILRWVNNGMKGGLGKIASYIGRPLTDYPGDGSEGWAFKNGGLIGWAKDAFASLANPKELIKKPFEAGLRQVPGGGMIKDFVLRSARKLLDGALKWLGTGFSANGGPIGYSGTKAGRVGQAVQFMKAQNGKPYVWNSAGPNGYDCSGIVSAAWNIINGRSPFGHTFSTGNLPGGFFRPGFTTGSPLLAGWSHPGQSPASASVGHMAGQIAGLPFESRGSRGVIVGSAARKVTEFANHGHFAQGGLLEALGGGIQLFDKGGYWPSGTLGANLSGRTEFVDPRGAGRGRGSGPMEVHVHFHNSVVASEKQAEDMVVKAVKSAANNRRLPRTVAP